MKKIYRQTGRILKLGNSAVVSVNVKSLAKKGMKIGDVVKVEVTLLEEKKKKDCEEQLVGLLQKKMADKNIDEMNLRIKKENIGDENGDCGK